MDSPVCEFDVAEEASFACVKESVDKDVYHKNAFAEFSVNVLESSEDDVVWQVQGTEFSDVPSVLGQGMVLGSASECSESGTFDLAALLAEAGTSPH